MPDLAADPCWMPHAYDPVEDRVQFLRIPDDVLAGPEFLAEYRPGNAGDIAWLPASAVEKMAVADAPIHFIFHTAFCRSTLLVRAIGASGGATGLNEPGILNSLSQAGRRGLSLLSPCLSLLARPRGTAGVVIVKPSNFANALIPHIMAARPGSRAILMSHAVEAFCGSVHRKGLMGRRWARRLYLHAQAYAPVDLGMDGQTRFELTDMQVSGLAWFLQHNWFARVLGSTAGSRLNTLDGDAFAAAPADSLRMIGAAFGLPLVQEEAEALAQGPLFASHAKLGGDYAAQIGRQEQAARSEIVDQEIAMTATWVGQIAAQAGLSLPVSRPLG